MVFFKKVLQSVLKEDENNIKVEEEITIVCNDKTSDITEKLEKGNVKDDDENKENSENEEDDEEDDDETNYRDKDKEAKLKYIEEMKKKSAKIAGNLKKTYKKNKKTSKKDDEYGLRTSERNLNREVGGMERDYAAELRFELMMRSRKRARFKKVLDSQRVIARRRNRRLSINNGFMRMFFRKILNMKKLKTALRGASRIVNFKALARQRNLNIAKLKAVYRKLIKAKKIEAIRKKLYKRAKEGALKKKSYQEMIKAQRTAKKAKQRMMSMD